MSEYKWPPSTNEEAEEWACDHPYDAVAYAALWTHGGEGYGPSQARKEWPACPGFDWHEGPPEYWNEDKSGVEYRTVLYDCGIPSYPEETADGWTLVASFRINPEPDLFDETGELSGYLYIGEYACELVYMSSEAQTCEAT